MPARRFAAAVLLLASSTAAHAGPYSDDLAKCLVASTTPEDRIALVRWMFSAFAAHPSVAPMSRTSPGEVESIDEAAGKLFNRLLTDACRSKTSDAIRYEGAVAIQQSFSVLGQVASMEMATNGAVQGRMAGMAKHVDGKALEELGRESAGAAGTGKTAGAANATGSPPSKP